MVFFLLVNPKNLKFPSSDSLNLYEVDFKRSFYGLFIARESEKARVLFFRIVKTDMKKHWAFFLGTFF